MVWAILDAEKDEITDCGSLPLVIDKKKCCPSHILEMASKINIYYCIN